MADIAERRSDADQSLDAAPGRRGVPRWAVTVAALIILLSFWEYFGRDINPIFGSYPSAIFAAFIELVRNGKLGTALLQSVQPFLVGYGLAIVIGVPLGLVIGRFWVAEAAATPCRWWRWCRSWCFGSVSASR
jgi:ABC-type nitrate/sulfonate/bicarbonate transport system permease component